MRSNGIAANGWGPYFAPDQQKLRAKVVNLGFVINVIEDFEGASPPCKVHSNLRKNSSLFRRCSMEARHRPDNPIGMAT
mgnify:CR=1 FL=1